MPLQIKFSQEIISAQGQIEKPATRTVALKGLKAWLGLWAVALLCVPVPVLHLVITPLALLLGPLIGILVFYKSRKMIALIETNCTCPNCQHGCFVQFKDTLPPLYGMCPNCKAGFQVLLA